MMQHQHEHIQTFHTQIADFNEQGEPLCKNPSCGYKFLLTQILQDISQIDHVKQLLLSKIFQSSKNPSAKPHYSAAPIPILTPKLNGHISKSQTQPSLGQIPHETGEKHVEKREPSDSNIGNLIKGIKSRTKGSNQVDNQGKKQNQKEQIISLLSDEEESNNESRDSSMSKSKDKKDKEKPRKLNKMIKKESKKDNHPKAPKHQASPQPQCQITSSTSTSKPIEKPPTKQTKKQAPLKFHHIIMNQSQLPISRFDYEPKQSARPQTKPTKMSEKQLEQWFQSAFPQKPYSFVLGHKFKQNVKHYYLYCEGEYKWFSIKDIENIDQGNTVKDYERSLARYA